MRQHTLRRLFDGVPVILGLVVTVGVLLVLRGATHNQYAPFASGGTLYVLRSEGQSLVSTHQLLVISPPHPHPQIPVLRYVRAVQTVALRVGPSLHSYVVLETSRTPLGPVDRWRGVLGPTAWHSVASVPLLGWIYDVIHASSWFLLASLVLSIISEVLLIRLLMAPVLTKWRRATR